MPADPTFDLTTGNDSANLQQYVNEHIQIGAAPINVYKLLGIKEFAKTQDILASGAPIASGEFVDFPAKNAFDVLPTEWRSVERGKEVTCFSYIGYDFGIERLPNGREIYPDQVGEIRQQITSIIIKQVGESRNRATKARVERSDNGTKWYGVDLIDLPDDTACHRYNLRKAAASRFWRIVPITFNGGPLDSWHVGSIEMSDVAEPQITDVQIDYGIMENIDRSYAKCPVQLKGVINSVDVRSDLTKFGLVLPELNETAIRVGFLSTISKLGRPFVIGDLIEIPHQAQYDVHLNLVKRYVEVVDVSWDATSYTPGWIPTIQLVTCQPAMASHETKDVFGDINKPSSDNKFANLNNTIINLEAFNIDDNIKAQADSDVPLSGSDTSAIRAIDPTDPDVNNITENHLTRLNAVGPTAYVEDGMPPNGEPYTEGETFPPGATNKAYHRLTYPTTSGIPARLHRFSSAKNRWIFIEEDKRSKYSVIHPNTSFLLSDTQFIVPNDQLGKL
jgi:hypothetical protein